MSDRHDPKNMNAMATNLEAINLANHDFSFSLYNELAKTETGNIFYSPFSIHLIMFMASVGAASKTFDEMIATIHLNKTTHSLEAYQSLLEELVSDSNNLKLATGMFVENSFNLNSKFVEKLQKYLQSSMEKLNFRDEPEAQRQFINNWVLNKTNNKIKDLFPGGSITGSTVLVLANAVHFKSGWAHKFKDTNDEPFYLTPTNTVQVKMMSLSHDLLYYHSDELKFAALELPYENHAFKMMILLPDAKDGLKDLEKNFSKINLHDISSNMSKYHVTVKLPRFKLEQSLDLKNILSNLGSPTMFTGEANFSNIAEGNLYVSKVVHKAYIDVDEKGTEAAAATGMNILTRCLMIPRNNDAVNFFANSPFVFFIMGQNNELIFAGRLQNLNEN